MAYAAAAGDEQHRGGGDAGHEERVVIGAAHHLLIGQRSGGTLERGDHAGIALRGRIATPRRAAISAQSRSTSARARSRRAPSISRTSISRRTLLGTLLTAPGKISQTPRSEEHT